MYPDCLYLIKSERYMINTSLISQYQDRVIPRIRMLIIILFFRRKTLLYITRSSEQIRCHCLFQHIIGQTCPAAPKIYGQNTDTAYSQETIFWMLLFRIGFMPFFVALSLAPSSAKMSKTVIN